MKHTSWPANRFLRIATVSTLCGLVAACGGGDRDLSEAKSTSQLARYKPCFASRRAIQCTERESIDVNAATTDSSIAAPVATVGAASAPSDALTGGSVSSVEVPESPLPGPGLETDVPVTETAGPIVTGLSPIAAAPVTQPSAPSPPVTQVPGAVVATPLPVTQVPGAAVATSPPVTQVVGAAVATSASKVFVSAITDNLRPTADSLSNHGAASTLTETGTGAFGQPMLRMLPKVPVGPYGGELSFTMKVDPHAQNHITFKLWGEEGANGSRYVLECEGFEVWGRRSAVIDQWGPATKARFWYRTVALPLHLTHGRGQVRLRLRSMGYISPYAALSYDTYQKMMSAPSRSIYGIWTHTDPYLELPGGEFQPTDAKAVKFAVESRTTKAFVDGVRTYQDTWVKSKLASTERLSAPDLNILGRTYAQATQSAYYKAPAVLARFVNDFDLHVAEYYASPAHASEVWGGTFHPVAYALIYLWDDVKTRMDDNISVGGGQSVQRRVAWAKAFRAGIDGERFGRRTITNQELEANNGIYRQNRALLLLNAGNAMPEKEARRYIDEAAGLLPFSGADLKDGGSAWPFGHSYYMINPEGTTREPGWVGSDYGGMEDYLVEFWQLTGDNAFRDKAMKMAYARARTQYFSDDGSTEGYSAMRITDPFNTRNDYFPGRPKYVDFRLATATLDPTLLAYVQQQIDEGQFWGNSNNWRTIDPGFLDSWSRFATGPRNGAKLPATPGQPDYAWTEPDDHIVTIKHGDEFLGVNLYRGGLGQARVFLQSPNGIRLGDVMADDTAYIGDGRFSTGNGLVDSDRVIPPDNPISANYGLHTPLTSGESGDCPITAGQCNTRPSASTFRFGNYLVGMNSNANANYLVKLPTSFKSGVDLITGKVYSAPIFLPPRTSVAFYLNGPQEGELPSRSMFITAAPGNAETVLAWGAAARATRYTVLRANAAEGPYQEIASGIDATAFLDQGLSNGRTYYYKVVGTNGSGSGGASTAISSVLPNSRTASADTSGTNGAVTSAVGDDASATPGLPRPWSFLEASSSALKGSASLVSDIFTLKTASYNLHTDTYKTSDDFAFIHRPMAGDATIVTRVASVKAFSPNSQSGLAVQGSLDPATAGAVLYWGNGTVFMGYRSLVGQRNAVAAKLDGYALPCWLKLTRKGQTVTGFASKDGKVWANVGDVSIPGLTESAYFGLVGTDNARNALATSVFDNTEVSR